MPARKIVMYPWIYYHVFNRSLTRQTIFESDKDYNKFYTSMLRFQHDFVENGLQIKAYCLMPNHFHLLLIYKTGLEDNPIMKFMHKLQISYAMYYKLARPVLIKWQPLFDGRYWVKPIKDDSYMWAIVNYIQKNSEKHLKIPYQDWKYRSDVKINWNYDDMMNDLDDYILEY